MWSDGYANGTIPLHVEDAAMVQPKVWDFTDELYRWLVVDGYSGLLDESAPVPPPPAPTTAERIVAFKDRSGLTWPQVAAAFGVTKRAVLLWKAGGPLSATHAERLMDLESQLAALDRGTPPETRTALMSLDTQGVAPYQRWVRETQRPDPVRSWASRQPR